jgi:hypothetical protein
MSQSRRRCADCGDRIDSFAWKTDPDLCTPCRQDYDTCRRCGRWIPLADMRQSYCVDCRRSYDRDRWARQRAARGVS